MHQDICVLTYRTHSHIYVRFTLLYLLVKVFTYFLLSNDLCGCRSSSIKKNMKSTFRLGSPHTLLGGTKYLFLSQSNTKLHPIKRMSNAIYSSHKYICRTYVCVHSIYVRLSVDRWRMYILWTFFNF